MKSIRVLTDKHGGETGYVVGKGPSILKLKESDFRPGPIIALNHAIRYVEALNLPNVIYSMQRDGCDINKRGHGLCEYECNTRSVGPTGCGGYPHKAPILLSYPESWRCYPDYENRYVFSDLWDLGFKKRALPSLPNAVRVLELMGVSRIKMLCCDCVDGDHRRVANTGAIERPPRFKADEKALAFYQHAAQLAQEAMSVPFEWVTIE